MPSSGSAASIYGGAELTAVENGVPGSISASKWRGWPQVNYI